MTHKKKSNLAWKTKEFLFSAVSFTCNPLRTSGGRFFVSVHSAEQQLSNFFLEFFKLFEIEEGVREVGVGEIWRNFEVESVPVCWFIIIIIIIIVIVIITVIVIVIVIIVIVIMIVIDYYYYCYCYCDWWLSQLGGESVRRGKGDAHLHAGHVRNNKLHKTFEQLKISSTGVPQWWHVDSTCCVTRVDLSFVARRLSKTQFFPMKTDLTCEMK